MDGDAHEDEDYGGTERCHHVAFFFGKGAWSTLLADAGYYNEQDLTDPEKWGVDGYGGPGWEDKQAVTRDLEEHPTTGRMVKKLAMPAGQAAYAQHKQLSETPNGWIKRVLGFRRFSLRGLAKVRREWDLVCLALDVKRPHELLT